MEAENKSIVCHENEVPYFVESEMEALYGNIFSSLLEFRTYGWKATDTSTYVRHSGEQVQAIFLFERTGSHVRVLNESIWIEKEEIERFADFIFSHYPDISVIRFRAIETNAFGLRYPYQRFNHLEDITLALPESRDAYRAALGKNTRRNIKRYGDRLRKSFSDLQFHVYEKEDILERHVRALIGFNRQRMANKQIDSVIDEDETSRIVELSRACGIAGILTINGEIVAGAIAYRVGRNYFLNVLSHHPDFDDYSIGFICCYEAVCACIERGGKEFHFLWGRYDYKFALGAVQRNLDNVTVYRSRLHFLLNSRTAWKQAADGYGRKVRVWAKYQDTTVPKMIRVGMDRLRTGRKFLLALHAHGRPVA